MGNKAYVCYSASGDWEDYREYLEVIFLTKEQAENWVKENEEEQKEILKMTKYDSNEYPREMEECRKLRYKEAYDSVSRKEKFRISELEEFLNEPYETDVVQYAYKIVPLIKEKGEKL